MLGHRMAAELLARPGFQERNNARCRALFGVGQFCHFMGSYRDATRNLAESLSIAREIGDDQRIAMVLQPLGMACLGEGDFRTARQYLEEGVVLAGKFGNQRELASAHNALAMLHRMEGRLDFAQPLYEKVVALARGLGDRESIAIGLLNLAMVSIARGVGDGGDPPPGVPDPLKGAEAKRQLWARTEALSRSMLLEIFSISAEIGSMPVAQSALEVCTGLAATKEEWEQAAQFFGAAEALAAQTGLKRDPADEAFVAPLIARTKDRLGTTSFESLKASGRAESPEKVLLRARAWLVPGGRT